MLLWAVLFPDFTMVGLIKDRDRYHLQQLEVLASTLSGVRERGGGSNNLYLFLLLLKIYCTNLVLIFLLIICFITYCFFLFVSFDLFLLHLLGFSSNLYKLRLLWILSLFFFSFNYIFKVSFKWFDLIC